MVTLHRRSRVGPVAPLQARKCRRPDHVKSGVNHDIRGIKPDEASNDVSAHLRTNLPRDHSAAQTYSATAAFLRSERCDPG